MSDRFKNIDLEFLDTVTLKPTVSLSVLRDGFADAMKKNKNKKKVLEVTFEATHSGAFQKGKAMYLPTEMAAAIPTWLSPFPKPVLKHHNDSEDAIGRIKNAVYVDTSEYFRAQYPHLTPILLSETPLRDKAKIAGRIIRDIYDKDMNYNGLGYARLTTEITDEEAIEKFLDGRYLTPSTYFKPKDIRCSICGQSVLSPDEEDPCEHMFGDMSADGIPFFLLPVGFDNREVSVVNLPGDKQAKAVNMRMLDSLTEVFPILCSQDDDTDRQIFTVYKDSLVEVGVTRKDIEMTKKELDKKELEEQKDNIEDVEETIEEEVVAEADPQENTDEGDSEGNEEEPQQPDEEEKEEEYEEDEETEETEPEDSLTGPETTPRQSIEEFLLKFKNSEEKVTDHFGKGSVEAVSKFGPYETFPADTKDQVEKGLEILKQFEDSEIKTMILEPLQAKLGDFADMGESEERKAIPLSKLNALAEAFTTFSLGKDAELEEKLFNDTLEVFEEIKTSFGRNETETKDSDTSILKIDILQTQLANEKNIVKALTKKIEDLTKDQDVETENEEENIEQPDQESEEKEGMKDADLSNIIDLEDPTLTGNPKMKDNDGTKSSEDYKSEYAGLYRTYKGLKQSGKEYQAARYLQSMKDQGYLPGEVLFD